MWSLRGVKAMYKFNDKRLHTMMWDVVESRQEELLAAYSDSDLSAYKTHHHKLGYIVGELYDYVEKKSELDLGKAFKIVAAMRKR
jgi:hypothetical protein